MEDQDIKSSVVCLDHTAQVSQGEGGAALNLVFQISGLQFSLAVVCIFDLTFFQICPSDCSLRQGSTSPGGEAHPCQPKGFLLSNSPGLAPKALASHCSWGAILSQSVPIVCSLLLLLLQDG